MDRRYYGIKALVLALAMALALVSSLVGAPGSSSRTVHAYYGAASTFQASVIDATRGFSQKVGKLIRQSECVITTALRKR